MKCPFRTVITYTKNRNGYQGNPYAVSCAKEKAEAETTEFANCVKEECPYYSKGECKRINS